MQSRPPGQARSKGEGLGNQFLSHIREVDAIAQVVRCFEEENVTLVDSRIDPVAHVTTIDTELCPQDLDTVSKLLDRAPKQSLAALDGHPH